MRIGSNPSGVDLTVQHTLMRSFALLNQSSERLSTMQRINHGSDDPAGLIAAAQLESELTSIEAANTSASRAAGMIQVADSALGQVSELVNTIRGNLVEAAGGALSEPEIAAKQLEIDAAVDAINRIGNSTSFAGRKLLDGSTMTFVFSPNLSDSSTLTMPKVSAVDLGGASGRLSDLTSGGNLSLSSGKFAQAAEVLNSARDQALDGRARIGAFEKFTIGASQAVLGSMEENFSAALSEIRDTDVAAETSRLVRSQILVDSGISTMLLAGRRDGMAGRLFGGF